MEILDLYDINGNKLNKTIVRGNRDIPDGEYFKVVSIWIKSGLKFLIQICSEEKGGEYAVTGGHVSSGNESSQQAIIESDEELGLKIDSSKLEYLGNTILNNKVIFDVYLYEPEENLEDYDFKLQKSEVEDIVWLSKDDIEDLIIKDMFRQSSAMQYFKFIKNI